MLYVYAITDVPQPPGVAGLDGASLRAIGAGGLAAVVSQHEELRRAEEADELWAHERVVEAAMEQGAVLPMRIGSVVEDEAAVASLLRRRGQAFRDALARVRGAVELGVRLVIDAGDDEPVAVPSGR